MKNLDLTAIKTRLSKITSGEWKTDKDKKFFGRVMNANCEEGVVARMGAPKPLDVADTGASFNKRWDAYLAECNANADFVAHAPEDVAALVAEVEKLKAKLKKTRDALRVEQSKSLSETSEVSE